MATFEVEGLEELNNNILKLIKAVGPEESEPILLKQAVLLRNDIRERAPKGPTGNLKKSLLAGTLKRREHESAGPAIVSYNAKVAPHAKLVEYGHGGPHPAPPHPFFRPGWDANKRQIEENIKTDLLNAIDKAVPDVG